MPSRCEVSGREMLVPSGEPILNTSYEIKVAIVRMTLLLIIWIRDLKVFGFIKDFKYPTGISLLIFEKYLTWFWVATRNEIRTKMQIFKDDVRMTGTA